MSAQNSDNQNFRFDWDNDGGLLIIMIMMIIMLGVAVACSLWIVNTGKIDHTQGEQGIVLDRKVDEKVSERDREFDETIRLLHENLRMLKEIQTTLELISSGLNTRVEPKEQASVAPSLGERGERP